jgi:3-phenylpropionate/cinnamic acid dioxygenase small subunit
LTTRTGIERAAVEELYWAYAAAIDDDLHAWPELFLSDGLYRVIARENYDRGLPMGTMLAEGHGMLRDRVTAIEQTQIFAPRNVRHAITNVRIVEDLGECVRAAANFMIHESYPSEPTRLIAVGRYIDLIARNGNGDLRFAEKICVYDGNLVLGSFIYPL